MEKVHNKSMKSTNIKTKLLVSAAMFVACLHPGSLLAQDAQQDQGAQTEEDTIVVVGSQIKGASVTKSLPVSVLGTTEIDAIGAASLDEVFRTLPGMGAQTFGAAGPNSVGFGINGARGDVASVNLRTLGAGNTLVLLNGRRLVDHSGTQTNEQTVPEVTVNSNQIPVMGIRRIEILRDGASAIYGTDAVAGVVNTVLRDDYEGLEVSSRYGSSFGTGLDEHTFNVIGGFRVNNDKTRITVSANRFERDAMFARERDYSRSSDLRPFLAGTPFEGDTDFNNRSNFTPWLRSRLYDGVNASGIANAFVPTGFRVNPDPAGDPIPIGILSNGVEVTSGVGRFTILPSSLAGNNCVQLPGQPTGTCISTNGTIPEALFFEPNERRTMIPATKRINLFSSIVTEMDNGWELYTELSYYTAKNEFNNGSGNFGSLNHSPVWIPASNYYNPFGPTLRADGSPNPYRLPNLVGVPDEGLAMPFDFGAGTSYRALETDRITVVEDESFRIVQGLRGDWKGWDFDTGFVYSESETLDRTSGRHSSTLFLRQLALDTPDAYNPFNGAGGYTNNAEDETPNPASVYNQFTIDVDRYSKTTLLLADFKVSKSDLFELPGGDVGIAFGTEFRRHTYLDDRDERLDGTVRYTDVSPFNLGRDPLVGDVAGSSPTNDTYGSRKVFSLFGELAVPLVGEDMEIPFVNSLDMQLAGRFENFDDIGSVFKPRVALSWYPHADFQLRGSYSLGFRAPNLPQTSEPRTSRTVGNTDFYYCQAAVNKGIISGFGECNTAVANNTPGYNYTGSVERITFGTEELEPEKSKSISFGAVWTPTMINGLILTVDYWKVKQEGIIGLFGTPEQLQLDYARRLGGSGVNENVIRANATAEEIAFFAGSGLAPVGRVLQTLNPYENLSKRTLSGIDFQAIYRLNDTSAGDFNFNLSATKLLKGDQEASGLFDEIAAANNPFFTTSLAGDILATNGRRPKWRANGSVTWFAGDFTTAINGTFIGKTEDLSATQNDTAEPFVVDSWFTLNTSVAYDFDSGNGTLDGLRVKLGINNLFDAEPPLADEAFGYFTTLHNAMGRYGYVDLKYEF